MFYLNVGKFFNFNLQLQKHFSLLKQDSKSIAKATGLDDRGHEPRLSDYYHVVYFTENSYLASIFFSSQLGFTEIYYSGLETGNKYIASRVMVSNNVIIELVSSLNTASTCDENANSNYFLLLNTFCTNFLTQHGDGIGMISFKSEKTKKMEILNNLKLNGKKMGINFWSFANKNDNEYDFILKIRDTNVYHLILNEGKSHFDNFAEYKKKDYKYDQKSWFNGLQRIDHIVLNVFPGELEKISEIYKQTYGLLEFWKPKSLIKTAKTGLNTKVLASVTKETANSDKKDYYKGVKLPINEPINVDIAHISQIEEFLMYNRGQGIQHIAFYCNNIIETVLKIKENSSIQFLKISSTQIESYYEKIWAMLLDAQLKKEDTELQKFVSYLLNNFDKLKALHILVDINSENEILLQIFTRSLSDKPGLFFEFIQRFRNQGFGEGNFTSLFKTIEEDQRQRGTLLK